MAPQFSALAAEYQEKLNTALLTVDVRFAKVDCATDKVLCNEQGIDAYPMVYHYHRGKKVAQFFRGKGNDHVQLAKWLGKQLADLTSRPAALGAGGLSLRELLSQHLAPRSHAHDVLLVLAVLAVTCRTVERLVIASEKTHNMNS